MPSVLRAMVIPRLVTSTPKLRINGWLNDKPRLLSYVGLRTTKPPALALRSLLKERRYVPPVAISCDTPTSQIVVRDAVDSRRLLVGVSLLVCWSNPVLNQSKRPYCERRLSPAISVV